METRDGPPAPTRQPYKWLIIGTLLIAAGLFVADHWVHIPRFLPYLLIALCPLMHLFGHGGHRHGAHGHNPARDTSREAD